MDHPELSGICACDFLVEANMMRLFSSSQAPGAVCCLCRSKLQKLCYAVAVSVIDLDWPWGTLQVYCAALPAVAALAQLLIDYMLLSNFAATIVWKPTIQMLSSPAGHTLWQCS